MEEYKEGQAFTDFYLANVRGHSTHKNINIRAWLEAIVIEGNKYSHFDKRRSRQSIEKYKESLTQLKNRE